MHGSASKKPVPKLRQGILPTVLVVALAVVSLVVFFGFGYYAGLHSLPASVPGPEVPEVGGLPLRDSRLASSINIVSMTSAGEGSVNQGDVEITPGNGRILFAINPFVEPDTQDSVQAAAKVAQEYTGKSLKGKDVIFSVENTDAKLVGGPSAGAAMTVATIAAIEGKGVKSDVAITGTINADGSIGQIGGVIEKATAAAEKGLSLFVVPKGQKSFTYYEQQERRSQRGNITIIRTSYLPKIIDLQQYLADQNYSMRIAEVSKIGDAVSLLLQ